MIAICLIRDQPHYRRHAFVEGLRVAGYSIAQGGRPSSKKDLLVIWNRYGSNENLADQWEQNGGTVLVCENGYCGRDAGSHQLYAISAHGHNGAGWFPIGEADRFGALGLDVAPWRAQTESGHLLVCGQRGIGSRQMASPHAWHERVIQRLQKFSKRPIRIRPHPGNKPAPISLDSDLAGAHAVVVWSSTSGVRALLTGVPVFYDAPAWICQGAALKIGPELEAPKCDDDARIEALRRMAWAQWTVDEIESGEPFVRFRDEAEAH